jgi:hypothetical protein
MGNKTILMPRWGSIEEKRLSSLDEYVVPPQHIEQGVVALKQRQRKLSLWCMLSAVLFIASSISYFLQPDFFNV